MRIPVPAKIAAKIIHIPFALSSFVPIFVFYG